jgi:hypothetical protein
MKVSEQKIIDVLKRFENGVDNPESVMEDMHERQPFLSGFIFAQPGVLLNSDEQELLLFAASVIWASTAFDIDVIPGPDVEETEESAWELFESQSGKTFREKIDPFFERIDEEELLAFVEDSLEDEPDSSISSIGREWIFITLAVLIEVLCEN